VQDFQEALQRAALSAAQTTVKKDDNVVGTKLRKLDKFDNDQTAVAVVAVGCGETAVG
jgi:hypothetical protein